MTKELLEKAREVVAKLPDHPRTKTGMFKPGKTDAHPQAGMFGGKKAKTPPKAKTKAPTVGVVAKRLILVGRTNAQVLEALGNQFGEKDFAVGGKHRYYSCWYRAQLMRRGELKAVRS